ncbi:hypothetical protein, partial [Burkholderia pseudomallei]|uniref:hypothetical protein n=1 Tax=Burkholderia pseudomallei TaxID=28450 RepID=UPI00194031C9
SKTRSSKIRDGWRVWNDWVAKLTRVSTAELRKTSSDPVCSLQFAVCSLQFAARSRIPHLARDVRLRFGQANPADIGPTRARAPP